MSSAILALSGRAIPLELHMDDIARVGILGFLMLEAVLLFTRYEGAVEAMANCRVQAEQLWMTIGRAARGE